MGKYIKKFDTHSDYEDFIETEDFIRPNVSYCVDNKDVHYNSIQTLFAIEFEAGKFAFGHASEDEIFLATKDGFSELWYADENGVITGNTPHAAMAHNIIVAYNEHFGTNINHWESEKETLQVGDTVTNWNAYEKIEIVAKLYLLQLEGFYVGAAVVENSISYYGNQDSNINIYNSEGILQETTVPSSLIGKLTQEYARLLQIELTSWKVLQRSGNIENLSEYVIIDVE